MYIIMEENHTIACTLYYYSTAAVAVTFLQMKEYISSVVRFALRIVFWLSSLVDTFLRNSLKQTLLISSATDVNESAILSSLADASLRFTTLEYNSNTLEYNSNTIVIQ